MSLPPSVTRLSDLFRISSSLLAPKNRKTKLATATMPAQGFKTVFNKLMGEVIVDLHLDQ